ncbi:hypothetical protein MNQ95_04025 [Pseudoxanthomonas daejeonensis]|uniref:hypothetical protein n=1 Tax=Pseudoxanthomonas daejeonensis TaxID=266062 RepID=UPI001F541ED6|nr:hypothetical protein [Pseudoxanthomonas daejeonensis]UNK58279.1 hypothetical protein MNQ95_04025 [Pseudoxanthomonas daejeonensis]
MKHLIHSAAALAVTALVAAGLLAACTPGGAGGGAAPVDLGSFDDPLKVTPTLDADRAVTQVVGLAGGTIAATAADGTVFTLAIPADSLRQASRITMTPVAKLGGLPFGDGTDVTVDLQPSGLVFDVPATLTIAPAKPIPAGERILYGYSDDRLVFAEPVLDAGGIAIVVPHFSGYGAARGFLGDVEEARKRIGGSAEERIGSEMRAALQQAHQAELRGEPFRGYSYLLDPYFEQFEREVIEPRLAAAGQSCAAGRSAIFTVLGYQRQRALLGDEDAGSMSDISDLLQDVMRKCMDEEYEMCVNEHVVHRLYPNYLGVTRTLEMLDISNAPLVEHMKRQVESCMRFELDFKVHTRFELDTRALNQSYLSFAESTELSTEIASSFGGGLYLDGYEPSSGPMQSLKQVYRQKAPGCVPGTTSTWTDTGHFLSMSWVVDAPDDKLGKIESIEVELGLPSPMVTISGMSCGGVAAPAAAELAGAPAAYLLNHGDGFIRDWKIHGKGEIIATAEWSNMNGLNAMSSVEDVGTATLRHTPR